MGKKLFILLTLLLFCFKAHSFGSFMTSSHILKKGEYDLTAGAQFFSNGQSGSNILIVADTPFKKDMNLRFSLSTGSLSFHTGAHLKWVPFEETKRRPNIGFLGSVEYASEDSIDLFLLRIGPFISKNFSWEHGTFEPYIGLPTGVALVDSESELTSQLILGTQLKIESLSYMSFFIEGGFKLKNSFSHVAIFATLQLGK